MDIQPAEDLHEVFRTFIEKFEFFFDDTDFRVRLRRDESKKVDYIFEVLDKHNDDIVIAEVNFKKIKHGKSTIYDKFIERGKKHLFLVKKFHASENYSSLYIIQSIYKVYMSLNETFDNTFYMIIERDTSGSLEFNRSSYFIKTLKLKNLNHLYLIYWLGHGKTALEDVHFTKHNDHVVEHLETFPTEKNITETDLTKFNKFTSQSFYKLIEHFIQKGLHKRNHEFVKMYKKIGLVEDKESDVEAIELIKSKKDDIKTVAKKLYKRIKEISEHEDETDTDVQDEMKLYDSMIRDTVSKDWSTFTHGKWKIGNKSGNINELLGLDIFKLVFKLKGKKRVHAKASAEMQHFPDEDEDAYLDLDLLSQGSSSKKESPSSSTKKESPSTKKMRSAGGRRRRRRTIHKT